MNNFEVMDFEMFKQMVAKDIKRYLPAKFKDYIVDVRLVKKINQELYGLSLHPANTEQFIAPNIYIDDLYEHYKQCKDKDEVLLSAARSIVDGFNSVGLIPEIDYTKAKDNIVMVLINTAQNRELLSNVPSRSILDLSIVYKWILSKEDGGLSSIIITNKLADELNMTEENLYNIAYRNTKNIFPITIRNMNEVLKDILLKDGEPEEDILEMINLNNEPMMFVISNDMGINGSSSILYDETLELLTSKLGSDIFILPSSIHELIVVSAKGANPEDLANMVSEVNTSEVSEEERLSYSVYHYSRNTKALTLAYNARKFSYFDLC